MQQHHHCKAFDVSTSPPQSHAPLWQLARGDMVSAGGSPCTPRRAACHLRRPRTLTTNTCQPHSNLLGSLQAANAFSDVRDAAYAMFSTSPGQSPLSTVLLSMGNPWSWGYILVRHLQSIIGAIQMAILEAFPFVLKVLTWAAGHLSCKSYLKKHSSMCLCVRIPRATRWPGPGLVFCSLLTACEEFCTRSGSSLQTPLRGRFSLTAAPVGPEQWSSPANSSSPSTGNDVTK